jgi:hypothetical protein
VTAQSFFNFLVVSLLTVVALVLTGIILVLALFTYTAETSKSYSDLAVPAVLDAVIIALLWNRIRAWKEGTGNQTSG